MKKHILFIAIAICTLTNTYAQEKLNIDISKSELKWFGDYTFHFGGHDGTIEFTEGHFIKTNAIITGGIFIIDMNSIICLDLDNKDSRNGLVEHLKNEDFFDVKNHATATLVITNVQYHDNKRFQAQANLTIKGITQPIKFQAEVDYETQLMTTKFKIDRTRWNINYNSLVKDNAISEAIGFEVKLSL